MLYIRSPGLIYFTTGSLYLLTPFTATSTPLFGNHQSILFLGIGFFFLKILHISKIIQYLSFSALFHLA